MIESPARLALYLRRHRCVDGWLQGLSAKFIAELGKAQVDAGVSGTVGEIGVHMGRLLILLALLRQPDEICFAVDVFGDQHLNVDRSGRGDLDIFLRNYRRWTGRDDVRVIQASSLTLVPEDIPGPCRLVSIDGGHDEECTLHDLKLIERCMAPGGVIILDDFFNQHWPGVAAGASRYILGGSSFKPFMISPNKLFLAQDHFQIVYRDHMRRVFGRFYEKPVTVFGNEVYLFATQQERLAAKIYRLLKTTLQHLIRG